MTRDDQIGERPAVAAASDLPRAWQGKARSQQVFKLRGERPWNWFEQNGDQARALWGLLTEFVAYLNARYIERDEQRIPPCWAEHGALAEELTTLYWARFHAFEADGGTIGGAQFWHNYSLPMFIQRMPRWLGTDRLRKCQSGKHEESPRPNTPNYDSIQSRHEAIVNADCRERPAAPIAPASSPRTRKSTPNSSNAGRSDADSVKPPEHTDDGTD